MWPFEPLWLELAEIHCAVSTSLWMGRDLSTKIHCASWCIFAVWKIVLLMCGDWIRENKSDDTMIKYRSHNNSFKSPEPVSSICNQLESVGVWGLSWFFSGQSKNLYIVSGLLEFIRERSHNSALIQLWDMKETCSSTSISLIPSKGIVVSH